MRIIGGYDYYDGVGGYQKDDLIFTRQKPYSYETKDTHTWIDLKYKPRFHPHFLNFYYYFVEVIFCGTYYLGIKHYSTKDGKDYYYWKYSDLVKDVGMDFLKDRYYVSDSNKKEYARKLEIAMVPSKFPNQNILIENKVVIATRGDSETNGKDWSINHSGLGKIGFASVIDPWTAYQEIEMFLGSLLVDDKDKMVVLSDKSKALKYGFDKYSFRNTNHPSKPRSGG